MVSDNTPVLSPSRLRIICQKKNRLFTRTDFKKSFDFAFISHLEVFENASRAPSNQSPYNIVTISTDFPVMNLH